MFHLSSGLPFPLTIADASRRGGITRFGGRSLFGLRHLQRGGKVAFVVARAVF